MCGISSTYISSSFSEDAYNHIKELILLGQTRGSDATGAGVFDVSNKLSKIYKEPVKAKLFVKKKEFKKLFDSAVKSDFVSINHNRLATNGSNAYIENNQPIYNEEIICVQNGIITNLDAVEYIEKKNFKLDTYAALYIFSNFLKKFKNIKESLAHLYEEIEGENTFVFNIPTHNKLVHATNCGTLYYMEDLKKGFFVSASEKYMLEQYKKKFGIDYEIHQLSPGYGLVIDYKLKEKELFSITSNQKSYNLVEIKSSEYSGVITLDLEKEFYKNLENLKRCNRCILPETFPGIKFNNEGVCNVCENYTKLKYKPIQDLEEIFKKYRSNHNTPDCLVAFSGGRDSSYGLHLIKEKYNMNPVAYSYDWGMVTDLARRNQARICGKLGIEHVWVSADIKKKRMNIRKNVEAWIKKPHIGMVPLFMAGDKTYFYHANRVMKDMNLNLIVFCPNNLERTNFKSAYCGIKETDFGNQVHQLKLIGKLKLLSFYATQYLTNPSYINSSIPDVMAGFLSYYVMNQDFLYLFDYESWEEDQVDSILKQEYDWEWDPTYPSSWRIGDGTAPLYNLIYYFHGGFTENDCFRSNQIREGVISRKVALERVSKENAPRFSEIEEYCKLINVDFVDLLRAIKGLRYENN